jgi:hypothetical protein
MLNPLFTGWLSGDGHRLTGYETMSRPTAHFWSTIQVIVTLVILGIGLTAALAIFVYRRVQQVKRAADENARQAAAIRADELERVRQAEQRQAVERWHAKQAEERKHALAANRVEFELGLQEEASRVAAVTCPHQLHGDPVPAFLAHGGAAAILKFNAPWANLFSYEHYPFLFGSVRCVCGKQASFAFSTSSMSWKHQMWCDDYATCTFCKSEFHLNLTTHGPAGLLLYIYPNADQPALVSPVEIMVDKVGCLWRSPDRCPEKQALQRRCTATLEAYEAEAKRAGSPVDVMSEPVPDPNSTTNSTASVLAWEHLSALGELNGHMQAHGCGKRSA